MQEGTVDSRLRGNDSSHQEGLKVQTQEGLKALCKQPLTDSEETQTSHDYIKLTVLVFSPCWSGKLKINSLPLPSSLSTVNSP
jgi:hypothetical protein